MRINSNDIRRQNMYKEQASRRTNKYGKMYVKHSIPGQKTKHLGNKTDKGHIRD